MSAPSERPRGVVTGAGGGIGKAVVHRLLREGARVLAVDAKAEGLWNSTARTAKRSSPTSPTRQFARKSRTGRMALATSSIPPA